jgi:CubicO group peptidase (beta-lactamase class C family)
MAHDVLGYLIAVLGDMPLETFLKDRIFKPLGMVDTSFWLPEAKTPHLAALYGAGDNNGLNLLDEPSSSHWLNKDRMPSGGGGLVSTTSDYLRFAQMLLNGGELDGNRILGRKTVELMTMNHLPSHLLPIWMGAKPSRGLGYGLGFGVVVDAAQTGMLGSKGIFEWGGAAATRFWVDPTESLIGLLMLQYLGLEAPVRRDFRNLVYQAIVD